MNRFTFATASLFATATLAIGCTSNDHVVTQQEYDDLAQHVGSTTATGGGGGETGSMSDAIKLSTGILPADISLGLDGHWDGNHLGVKYDYQLSCSDASGAALPTCGATTDRADVQVAWSGDLELPRLSAMVDRHGQWTITGLQAGPVKLDGTGSFTFDSDVKSIFANAEAKYHLAYDGTYTGVTFDGSHVPVAGTIHYTIAASHMETSDVSKVDASFDVDAVLTFTGSGKATLVLDGDQQYSLDLATGLVIHIHS